MRTITKGHYMPCWMGAVKKASGRREYRGPAPITLSEEEREAKNNANEVRLTKKRRKRALTNVKIRTAMQRQAAKRAEERVRKQIAESACPWKDF